MEAHEQLGGLPGCMKNIFIYLPHYSMQHTIHWGRLHAEGWVVRIGVSVLILYTGLIQNFKIQKDPLGLVKFDSTWQKMYLLW